MLSSNLVLLVIVFLICTAISYYFKIIAQVLDHIENQSSFTFGNRHFWYFIVLFFIFLVFCSIMQPNGNGI